MQFSIRYDDGSNISSVAVRIAVFVVVIGDNKMLQMDVGLVLAVAGQLALIPDARRESFLFLGLRVLLNEPRVAQGLFRRDPPRGVPVQTFLRR